MTHLHLLLHGAVIALTLGVVSANAQISDFQPVTDEILRNPSDADWLQWRRTYDGWAYSPLDQIDRGNVQNLQLVWSRALNAGQVELIPLVYDGVMYIPHPGGVIEAVDATTGDLIWRYRHALPEGRGRSSGTRNIAIYDDKIFFAVPVGGSLVALDARTGAVVWETQIEENARHSSGPIVVGGNVLTGRACSTGGANGVEGGCFIAAHDAETGEELWRRFTIARPGEPGGNSSDADPFYGDDGIGGSFAGGDGQGRTPDGTSVGSGLPLLLALPRWRPIHGRDGRGRARSEAGRKNARSPSR